MNIFICEDAQQQRDFITTTIRNYIMFEQLDMNIKLATDNPEAIIDAIKDNEDIGLYFLDIHLNHEMSGIMLAKEIRKYDPLGSIIFVTSHSELTYLTFVYKVSALDFIIKDDPESMKKRIIECLNVSYERLQHLSSKNYVDKLEIKSGSQTLFIDYDEIIFFESSPNPHRIILHLNNRVIEFYGSLKDYETIDERFFRCHHSYIINKDHITSVNKKERIVHFTSGDHCYISIRNLKKL